MDVTESADGRRAGQPVAIGLGSNLGDRAARLRFGAARLRGLLEDARWSSIHETVPELVEDQPPYLNACCVGRTRLTPQQLLSELQDAERRAGRKREGPRFGARTLDLDLLLYGEQSLETEMLTVPHARMRERAFVLVPLEEIAPDWRVPAGPGGDSTTVRELAEGVDRAGVQRTEIPW